MKLAHIADLHLGFRQYTRQTALGINQREADVAAAFRRVIDDIIAAVPDAVVIAGDVFHSVRPTNPAILDCFNQLRRFRERLPECPVVVVAGNHDTPRSVETGSILQLFEAIGGVHTATDGPRAIRFEPLQLTVTAFPRASVVSSPRPTVLPDPEVRWNVLLMHGEVAGVVPGDRSFAQQSGAVVEPGDLHAERWDYVALGHYHVATELARNVWYSGSLEYVSPNPWGELRDGAHLARFGSGKGWLLVHLDDDGPHVEFRPVAVARRHIDLEPIYCSGMAANEVDRVIAARVDGVVGGIDDQVVRQVLYDVPRVVARDLDHAAIREYKVRALHYRFDPRRPEATTAVGVGTPGRRQTLAELVDEYLDKRPVTPGVDGPELVRLARRYLDDVERELAGS